MKPYLLAIEADCNDGDYVTSTTPVDAADLEKLKPIIEALRTNKGHYGRPQWATGEIATPGDKWNPPPDEVYPDLTEEQIEWFTDLCPSGESGMGIHTIISVQYYPVESVVKLI